MLIDVVSCKSFDAPHKHGTDRTVIYSETGISLGPRFEVCPFETLRAKDAARETFLKLYPNTRKLHIAPAAQPKEKQP